MAIVIVSPKSKQRIFFVLITIALILFLGGVAAVTLLPDYLNSSQNNSLAGLSGNGYNKPNIKINLGIANSATFKSLEPFAPIPLEFTYTVQDKFGRKIRGNILATSKDEAQKLLEDAGFKILSLDEMLPGRPNPFISY